MVVALIDSAGGDQTLAGADFNIVNKNIPAGGTGTQKYVEATIGDGTAQSFTVNHNLGTADIVKVSVIENATGIEWLTCVTVTDANNVTVDFDIVPTAGQFRVVVVG